ncbi:MAG: ferric uptake regulator family protein [SAR324 cluster bacterium]|uniref:Ferric uptake regulator family protein n=1 Tax=SAR324 cluster bacterium TaxID=2024889 RepID=A0A2A4SSU7_9DELT|nr:MAG: ferric uptake regulator family protein [SAR324 cluster bacterium]
MCQSCNTSDLLQFAGIKPNLNRRLVLDLVTGSEMPLSSQEILELALSRKEQRAINRVTMYRILDLLVEKGLLNRLSSPDRTDRYCMRESKNHPHHVHFFCEHCQKMLCLPSKSIVMEPVKVESPEFSRINSVQVLLGGVCRACDSN